MKRRNGFPAKLIDAPRGDAQGLERFFDLSGELLCVIRDGRFARVSSAWEQCLGWPLEALLGRPCADFIHAEDLARTMEEAPVTLERELVEFENRYRHRDGSYRWLAWNACVGAGGEIYAVARDVTELRRRDKALRASDERHRLLAELGLLALEGKPVDALIDRAVVMVAENLESNFVELLELRPDRESLVLRAGVGWKEGLVGVALTPFTSEFHAGFTFGSLGQVVVHDFEAERRFKPAPLLRDHGVSAGASVILGGKQRPFGVLGAYTTTPRTFANDEVNFLQAVANIVTDAVVRERTEARIRYQALHDPLTELPNRSLLLDRMQQWRERAPHNGIGAAVMFLDVDHVKVVNDGLGHDAGDKLLVDLAGRLRGGLRASDTVARLGGDEFVLFCENVIGERDAKEAAERVMACFEEPFTLGAHRRQVTASIGVVLADPRSPIETLIRDADVAMYRAKTRGRARLQFFDQAMREQSLNRLQLEQDLHLAIEEGQFFNAYQPIVSPEDGSIFGLEALARWRHPRRGVVPPAEFIPVAEKTGLIVRIGEMVLEDACREAFRWLSDGLLPQDGYINVNLSPRQVTDPGLVDTVVRALEETRLAPARLSLEITESVLVEDAETALEVLTQLKSLGVRLVLDDFGTGYSSLSQVRRFPIDILKIDRSFVEELARSVEDAAIVEAVVSMGKALGVGIIAEGVETCAQADRLRALGCKLAQGYLFARPLDPAAATNFLAEARGSHRVVRTGVPHTLVDGSGSQPPVLSSSRPFRRAGLDS
jgi:diguanylate cyclase (GGDEF)-like protein/PAS domain S-box-containing protein